MCRWLSKISSWSQVTIGAAPTNVPLVTLVTNGAPAGGAPLVVLQKKQNDSSGARGEWCAISIFGKNMLVVAHHECGAPLVSITLMAHQHTVRHCYIVVAHRMSGASLVSISSIALFLVVVF